MNNYILDTDIVVDVLRGLPKANEFINELEEINITSFTAMELIDGCKDKKSLNLVKKLLEEMTIIFSTPKSQASALAIFNEYKLSKGIGLIDSLISGIVLEQNFVLVTRNFKHFDFIYNIKVESPY